MPRSASDRGFGFKSPGLIRILTAADPNEVLTAMEALGITFAPVEFPVSSARLLKSRNLLDGLLLISGVLDTICRQAQHLAQFLPARRTREQAILDSAELAGLRAIYNLEQNRFKAPAAFLQSQLLGMFDDIRQAEETKKVAPITTTATI